MAKPSKNIKVQTPKTVDCKQINYPKHLTVQDELSQQVLDRLHQETKGFLLFSVDSDGDVKVYTNFDDSITAIGLIEFAKMWGENCSMMNQDQIMGNIGGDDTFTKT